MHKIRELSQIRRLSQKNSFHSINHKPGDAFRVSPYRTWEECFSDGRRGQGFSDISGNLKIYWNNLNLTATGCISVLLPDRSDYIMQGRFMHIPGTINAWRFVSDLSQQPLSIIIDRFNQTFFVTVV